MRRRLTSVDVLLLVTVLIWSFHFVVIKYGLTHGFSPLVYATLRFGFGSLIFAGITYGLEHSLRVRRGDVWLLCGAIALSLYLNQMSFAKAVQLTTASTVALLFGTLPIFVALMGWALGVERPHARHWAATALSFAGVALVASGAQGGLSGDLGGILIGIVAPITWAFYTVVAAPLMSRYSPYRVSAVVGLAAIVPLTVTAIPQFAGEDWSEVTTLAWAALAYSMIFSFVITNVLWFKAIREVGTNRASVYANLQPFLGAIFAVLVLSETMSWVQVAGGVVIGAGILIARSRTAPVEVLD